MTWRSAPLPPSWHKIRGKILKRDPICRACLIAPSTEVDHTGMPDEHGPQFLRGICGPCHRTLTARQANAVSQAHFREKEIHPGRR